MEININSQSFVEFSQSEFVNNTHSGLVYVHLHSPNISVSMNSINIANNIGFSLGKAGGLILFEVSENLCNITLARFKMISNQFVTNNDFKGGGICIFGILPS